MALLKRRWRACVLAALASVLPLNCPAEPGPVDHIVAVFPEQFPPLFFVTSSGVPNGFAIEVMEEVAQAAGLQVEYRPVPSWEQAHEAIRSGSADVIPSMGITRSRDAFADFTRPIETISIRLFVLRGAEEPVDLNGFRNTHRVIGVVPTNVAVDVLKKEPGIRVRTYPHAFEALLDLIEGRVDAIAYPDTVVHRLARRMNVERKIQAVGEPLANIDRAIAVAAGREELRQRLDNALASVLASPAYAQIYERWHDPAPPFWTARRVGALIAALLALAAAGGLYMRIRLLGRANRELRHANAFTRAVLDAALEGILTVDRDGAIRSVNPSAERMFQRTAGELTGARIHTVMPRREADAFVRDLEQLAADPPHTSEEEYRGFQALRRDGTPFPVHLGVSRADVAGEPLFVCTFHDISLQRQAEQRASYVSDHDPLTGLLNSRGSELVLENLLAQSKRHDRHVSCLIIGIDRLGHINDVYGRPAGDAVLVALAQRIAKAVRRADAVSYDGSSFLVRAGGDRFLAVLPETTSEQARTAALRILAEIERDGFDIAGQRLHIVCRAGIASFPAHAETAHALLSRSEAALKLAKEQPADRVHVFESDDDLREQTAETWVNNIGTGVQEGRFMLQYQPIRHIGSGTVSRYEALVRYRADDGALVPPAQFIPIAERFGLIGRLDTHVMGLAFAQLAELERRQHNVSLSINLSGAYIGHGDLLASLEQLLDKYPVQPEHVIFEVTETAALHNILQARAFIESVNALGCRFALDDFGVGFSSFSHLRNLAVDIVKIDGSFIRNLPESIEDQAMVRSLTDVAHSLGKEVVAEFVSSQQILDMLPQFGVDFAQGFHIGRPEAIGHYIDLSDEEST